MAVLKCTDCGGAVSTSAKACPHCGAIQRKRVGVAGWAFALLIVLPLAWYFGSSMDEQAARVVGAVSGEATDVPGKPPHEEVHALCSEYSGLAKVIMEKRQEQVPVSQLIEVAGDDQDVRRLVLAAYEVRSYQTSEMKERKIADFEDAAYLNCTKSM